MLLPNERFLHHYNNDWSVSSPSSDSHNDGGDAAELLILTFFLIPKEAAFFTANETFRKTKRKIAAPEMSPGEGTLFSIASKLNYVRHRKRFPAAQTAARATLLFLCRGPSSTSSSIRHPRPPSPPLTKRRLNCKLHLPTRANSCCSKLGNLVRLA